jgi:hypothetical protein
MSPPPPDGPQSGGRGDAPATETSGHGLEIPTALAPPVVRPSDDRFVAHLVTAGEHVAAKRYREAEVEVLRALSGLPADLRALNLLALVRFKLGRLDEARATYGEIAEKAPNDATVRRNLGLMALKLERIDEAIPSLEMAARLAPGDQQAWSYLGYAYAKKGEPVAAAAAFRRAGQDALAAELELAATARRPPSASSLSALQPSGSAPAIAAPSSAVASAPSGVSQPSVSPAPPLTAAAPERAAMAPTIVEPPPSFVEPVEALRESILGLPGPVPAPPPPAVDATPVPLLGFVMSRLGLAAAPAALGGAALRMPVDDEAHMRADAVLAAVGVTFEPAFRRLQGRRSARPLGTPAAPFFRAVGRGEVWLAGAPGRWLALSLDDDVLYVREDRVLAFDGGLSWEAGAIPGDGLRMLQFRGRGCVVLELEAPPAALKVTADRPATIASRRLLGWVGRLVTHQQRAAAATPLPLACEGDGVMLFSLDGEPRRPSASGASG